MSDRPAEERPGLRLRTLAPIRLTPDQPCPAAMFVVRPCPICWQSAARCGNGALWSSCARRSCPPGLGKGTWPMLDRGARPDRPRREGGGSLGPRAAADPGLPRAASGRRSTRDIGTWPRPSLRFRTKPFLRAPEEMGRLRHPASSFAVFRGTTPLMAVRTATWRKLAVSTPEANARQPRNEAQSKLLID